MSTPAWPNLNVALPGGVSPQPYADYGVALNPPWLAGPMGEGWASAIEIMADNLIEAMTLAVKARFLTTCPPDAIPYIGQERAIDQLPHETLTSYRGRLLNAWATWRTAGTRLGVYNAVTFYGSLVGFSTVEIRENVDWAWPPSPGYAAGAEWWRFWVIVDQPNPFAVAWKVGDGSLIGQKAIGFAPDPFIVPNIKSIIAKWKPAHALLVNLIIVLSGKLVGNGWNVGDGTLVGGSAAYC